MASFCLILKCVYKIVNIRMGLQRFFAESTKQKNGDNFDINMKIKDCFYNVFSSICLTIFCHGLAMLPYFYPSCRIYSGNSVSLKVRSSPSKTTRYTTISCSFKKECIVSTAIRRALALGYPYTPEDIRGKAIEEQPCFSAREREFV